MKKTLAEVEIGEASSPPEPQEVSKKFVEHADSDFSNGDEFIAYPNIPQGLNGNPRHYMQ